MDVSIILVNYNTRKLLTDSLESIYHLTSDVVFEVIVVDNASSDGSEEYVRKRYPDVIWINSGENLGFGRANNLGASRAKGKYLFFLNTDTLLLNNAVAEFLAYAETHEVANVGALGCWLLDADRKPNASYGFFPNAKSEIKYLLGKYPLPTMQMTSTERQVDYVIGADLFVSKKLFEHMGGFDPHIFMYYEETDLQYRMAQAGWKRVIIPSPQIIHLEGGSFESKGLSFPRFVMAQHSYNYYLSKQFSGLSYWYNKCMLCLLRLTLFIATDWSWKDKWHAYLIVFAKN